MDKFKDILGNEKVQAALKEFGRAILTAITVLVVALLAVANGALAPTPSGGIGTLSTNQKITTDRAGQTLNVLSGGQLSAAAGSTVVFNGDFQPTVIRVNGTPVFWPTAIATPTKDRNVVATSVIANSVTANTGVYTTSVSIAGTPVIPFSTAIPTPTPAAVGGLYRSCGQNTITGTLAINHALATPSYVSAGLAQDAAGDAANVSWTNASATVTLKVWNSALTPVANSTGAIVDWCVFGTK